MASPKDTADDEAIECTMDVETFEASRRRYLDELVKKFGGTEGYIGHVVLGPAIVEARPPGTRIVTVMTGPGSYVHPPVTLPPCASLPPLPSPLDSSILDAIHGHIIHALPRLPRDAVRAHVRGVVLAGHCYGCLGCDPASNVLMNALWYDATFPPCSNERHLLDMVGAAALYRCARRSLDGLVAFMRSYCPDDEKTLRCLAASGADLSAAVRMATGGELFGVGASPRVRDAFESAAKAARHPDPAMFARFSEALMGPDPGAATVRFVLMLACSTGTLSPATVDTISAALRRLMHGRVHTPPLPAPQLSRGAQRAVGHTTDAFMERQASMATIVVGVGLALQKHAMQTGEALSLHLICGASRFRRGCEIVYHINFLATKGMFEAPTLFFAEFNALVRDAASDMTLCRRVPASQGPGGCEACEFVGGQRLVHPAGEEFKGRVIEFAPGEESLKKHPDNEIFGGPLDEDYVFFDAGLHPEMTRFLEDRYSAMDDDHVDLTFMRF